MFGSISVTFSVVTCNITVLSTAGRSQTTTNKQTQQRETKRDRGRGTSEPESLMSFLTRFGEGGSLPSGKLSLSFFLALSLPMPPLSVTHLLMLRIPSSIKHSALLSFWPLTHYSCHYRDTEFPRNIPHKCNNSGILFKSFLLCGSFL